MSSWLSEVEIRTDSYSFSALPGGFTSGTMFIAESYYAVWWTATEEDDIDSFYLQTALHESKVDYYYSEKNFGFSVRCLQD